MIYHIIYHFFLAIYYTISYRRRFQSDTDLYWQAKQEQKTWQNSPTYLGYPI